LVAFKILNEPNFFDKSNLSFSTALSPFDLL